MSEVGPEQVADRAPVALVVNPARTDIADDALAALAERGIAVREIRPNRPDDLPDAMRQALQDGAAVLAPVGGDGTQRTAAVACRGTDAVLAVVPGGTVNLLGKVLGITSPEESAAAIADDRRRVLDIGLADDEPFLLNASTGYDAAVIRAVDEDAKRLGLAGFLVKGVSELRTHRPRTVTVTVDGEVAFRDRAMSVIICNVAQRAMGEFYFAPDADPGDGRLDVVVQRSDSLGSLVRAGWALLRRRPPRREDLRTFQGREILVEWSGERPAQIDGDAVDPARRVTYTVEPSAVTVLEGPTPPVPPTR